MFSAVFTSSDLVTGGGTGVVVVGVEVSVVEGVAALGGATIGGATVVVGVVTGVDGAGGTGAGSLTRKFLAVLFSLSSMNPSNSSELSES